jgi:hypothetical protein
MSEVGGAAMTILFELDPNVVKPGWTPLLILIGLAVVMALLFRSMRRQFRRVHENFPEPTPRADSPAATESPDGSDAEPTADGVTTPVQGTGEGSAPGR